LLFWRIIFPVFFFTVGLLSFALFGDSAFGVIMLSLGILYLIFFDTFTNGRIKQDVDRHKQVGKAFGDSLLTYRFGENSYTSITKSHTGESTYENLLRVDVGKQAIYIYEGSLQMLVLPNRIFANDEEKERFVAFIQWKISEIQAQKTQTCCSEAAAQ
ncbi:MAG: YcxB family protein, partial [Clostridia bacterium]|nr:YcxB family protein [Clostridia bacterium]